MRDGNVDSSNGRIHFAEVGQGPPLLLLHGGGPGAYGLSNFQRNVDPLARSGRRVIVVDLPGFGGSEPRDTSEGLYVTMAQAVFELVEHLRIDKASAVGNSLGGGTALQLALTHPERVDKLILMGPGGSLPATSNVPSEGLSRMLTFYDGEGPTLEKLNRVIDLLVYDRSSITPELIAQRFKAATLPHTLARPPLKGQANNPKNELWRGALDKLPHKTLIVWGREDRVIPLDAAFILLKRIPNADFHVFSKCGHWAQWEKADQFNRLVSTFLES